MATNRMVVLFETASNQRYLFETNRRALAAGASELTRRSTVDWVEMALQARGVPTRWDAEGAVGPIFTSSGSTLVVIDADPDLALALTSQVSLRAVDEAPGLRLYTAWSEPFDWETPGTLHRANAEVHHRIGAVRHRLPDVDTRFQRLPWVAECPESGLPTAATATMFGTTGSFASPVIHKWQAAREGADELRKRVTKANKGGGNTSLPLASADEELDADGAADADEEGWVAIIHADGNGVGQMFLDFERYCETRDNTTYALRLGQFSAALDDATLASFIDAATDLARQLDAEAQLTDTRSKDPKSIKPKDVVFPLVLAGDDLTCQITGRRAVRFAHTYLGAFRRHTAGDERITALANCRNGVGAAAGIALVKPRFPFWQAYRLAEDLCSSAKQVKRLGAPVFALDVHVLFDSIVSDLDDLRLRATGPAGRTWGGPYVVALDPPGPDATAVVDPDDRRWAAAHQFDDLERAFELLAAGGDDDGDRLVPSRVVHRLRSALLGPPGAVAVVLDDLGDTLGDRLVEVAAGTPRRDDADDPTPPGLFVDDGEGELTRFVDAMTLADLCAGVTAGLSAGPRSGGAP